MAALLGTVIYFAVLKITGHELGLIAIIVGLLVGRAPRLWSVPQNAAGDWGEPSTHVRAAWAA